MDLDAVLFLCEKVKAEELSENDLLMISSSISNGCVDINKSLNELLKTISETENIPELLQMIELDNISFTNPLFMVLISKHCFENMVVTAIKKKQLSDESFCHMLEAYFDALEYLEEAEINRILCFIIEVVNARGRLDIEKIQDIAALRRFIVDNLSSLSIPKNQRDKGTKLTRKLTIIKLFSQGYITFGKVGDISIDYEDIFVPLIESKNYRYVRLVINSKTIPVEDIDYVEKLLLSTLKEVREDATFEELISIEQTEKETRRHLDAIKSASKYRNM